MPRKDENWWPGIQKQEPFRRGVVIDDPKNLLPRNAKEEVPEEQQALPMDVSYLEPALCPECYGKGTEKRGRICRECRGKGVVPAEVKAGATQPGECEGEAAEDC